jgi:hypothetical protein
MVATQNSTSTEQELAAGGSSGAVLGQATTDKIAFFGSTPSAQVTITDLATGATITTVVTFIQDLTDELQSKGLIG